VIIGIGDTCLKHTLELLKLAEELGADGVLSVCPYYAVYEERMVEAYYDAVAQATSLPVILYNFPTLTGFCLMPGMVKRLAARHKNILGIKETIADPSHVKSMMGVKEVKPDFAVFGAFEDQGIGLAALHIDGYIDATANFAPEFTVGLIKAMKENDWAKAAECHRGMCEAMELYNCASPIFIGVKEGVYQRVFQGQEFGERLPALPLSQEGKDWVHAKLQSLNLL
jgi:2-dehydro-3-deoxy-D-pentonate aldolase